MNLCCCLGNEMLLGSICQIGRLIYLNPIYLKIRGLISVADELWYVFVFQRVVKDEIHGFLVKLRHPAIEFDGLYPHVVCVKFDAIFGPQACIDVKSRIGISG